MSQMNTGGAASVLELVRQRQGSSPAAPAGSVLELVRRRTGATTAPTAQPPEPLGPPVDAQGPITAAFARYGSISGVQPQQGGFVGPRYPAPGPVLPGVPLDTLGPGQLPPDMATARPDLEYPEPRSVLGELAAGVDRGIGMGLSAFGMGGAGADVRPSPAPEGAGRLRRFAQAGAGMAGEFVPAIVGGVATGGLAAGAGAGGLAASLASGLPMAAGSAGATYDRTGSRGASLASAALTAALAPLQVQGVLGRIPGLSERIAQNVAPKVAAYVARRGAEAGFNGAVNVAQAYIDEEIAQMAGSEAMPVDALGAFAGGAAATAGLGVGMDAAGRGMRGVRAVPEGPLVRSRAQPDGAGAPDTAPPLGNRGIDEGVGSNDEPAGSGPSASVAAKSLQNLPMQPGGGPRVSPTDLFDAMKAVGGVPIRFGRGLFGQRQAAGWYSPTNKVIRNRAERAIDTGLHEVGHAIHDKQIGWNVLPAGTKNELHALGKALYGSRKPNGGYRREGVAEYVARTLLGEDGATLAPKFHDWFTNTFLPSKPDFAAKYADLAAKTEQWKRQGARARLSSQIEKVDTGPVSTIKRAAAALAERFQTRYWTDDAAPLRRAEAQLIGGKDVPPTQRPYTMYRALQMTAPGTARTFLERAAVDTAGNKVGKSLRESLEAVKPKMEDWVDYAVARRAQELHKRGINPGVSKDDADFVVNELESPAFKKALDEVTAWGDNLLQYLADSGGLSPEGLKKIRDLNPVWIPFQRVFDDSELRGPKGIAGSKGVVNQGRAVKSIKGSARAIADPLATLAQQAEKIVAIGNKMSVARSVADLADRTPGSAWFAEKLPKDQVPTSFSLADIQKQVEELGGDLSGADLDGMLTVFSNAFAPVKGKENIVTIWRNGEQEWWELDADVYRVVTAMDKEVLPSWARAILGPPKRLVQLGATGLNTSFSLVTNPIRDAMTWTVYSRSKGVRTPFAVYRGLWQDLTGGDYAKKWKALGGEMGTLMGQDRADAKRMLDESMSSTARNIARHPLDTARKVLGVFESAPRIEEFRRTLAEAEKKYGKGSRDASIEALLASKDVTTDFTRAGLYSRALNQMVPFFNAAVQGPSKFYRTFSGAEGAGRALSATAAAFAGITLPSLLLWWANHDEEWYQDLPRWEKNAFWHFSPDGGRTIIKLPKPFDLGYVFGSLPQAALDSAFGKDPKAVGNALWETAHQFTPIDVLNPKKAAFDAIPALLKPAAEAAANYDSFRERPIVSKFDEASTLPEDQFNRYTSAISKRIGGMLNVSPAKVDHVLRGYSGGMLTRNASSIESMLGLNDRGGELADIPVAGALFARRPEGTRSQRYMDMMDRVALLRQKKGSDKATPMEVAELRRLERFSDRISEVRKAQDSGRLKPEAAAERIKSLVRTALGPEALASR